eukprot:6178167-Pleurochrysis_carterae.AAC.3
MLSVSLNGCTSYRHLANNEAAQSRMSPAAHSPVQLAGWYPSKHQRRCASAPALAITCAL